MARRALEVADIFHDFGPAWRRANAGHVSLEQMKVMSAIERCRTAALGGHVARCQECDHTHIAYNSCRNRHCPKCQGAAARDWLADRQAELLPVEYFHLVFTLPRPIADIAYRMFTGNPEDALAQLDRAQRLNPFGRYGYVIGMINYSAKRYEDAIAALKTVRHRNPAVHAWLAASYAQLERSEEAKAASAQFVAAAEAGMQKVGASPPDSWLLWFANRHPYTRRADLEHVLEGLRKAGLSE